MIKVSAVGESVHVDAGLIGPLGWHGVVTELTPALVDEIAGALVRELTTLTIDRITVGRRYRVLETLQQLTKGDVVTFVGYDDIDNHYGKYDFQTSEGRAVSVSGDFSTLRSSPLGEAHRYLAEAD